MALRMIRIGMLAGFGFLLATTVLEMVAGRPGSSGVRPVAAGVEGDVTSQVWAVLAEARRILEESA